ncbi:MAG: OmpA family protein [Steroidobacteraceae bacterium]|nr:OmpA family protein [Steroidobacteraceae bacterium]
MRGLAIFVLSLLSVPAALAAETPVPGADLASAKDPASLGRFTGSKLITYTGVDYDTLTIPLDTLKVVPGQRDNKNNAVHAPSKKLELEGRRQHYVYLLPEGTSPLAAIRNYQNAAKPKGGKSLYECLGVECGGGQRTVSSGGGGNQSIGMLLWPMDKVLDKFNSPAHCAVSNKLAEQRFTALEIPSASIHATVLAFTIEASADCKNFNGRTFAMVDTLETKAMAQTMDTPSASDMVASITTSGRIALYGILFDSGKTEVKVESKTTMDEIAKLLAANRSLKLLVVGHTDNVGGFGPNLDLSKRRAESVVAQLVSQYKIDAKRLQAFGVSYASPIAPNTDDAGRGKNRRVELVAN